MRSPSTLLVLLGLISAALATDLIYLYPSPDYAPDHVQEVTSKEAKVALAHHLGLEAFESIGHGLEENEVVYDIGKTGDFLGQGPTSVAVLSMSEEDARDIIPQNSHAIFSTDLPSTPSLLSTYAKQASEIYETVVSSSSPLPQHGSSRLLDIFSLPATPASTAFTREASSLNDFLEFDTTDSEKFGSFEITSLSKVAEEYGRDSEEYRLAKITLSLLVESFENTMTRLAIIVSDDASHPKRQQPPEQSPLPPPVASPHEPISAISTCYTSAERCESETDSCSGHGSCVAASKAGHTCYVCACSSTQSNDGRGHTKTTKWAGTACERKDVSSEFVLLAGTTIGLILFVFGSIALLVAAGDQKLPSVLTGGVVNSKKDN